MNPQDIKALKECIITRWYPCSQSNTGVIKDPPICQLCILHHAVHVSKIASADTCKECPIYKDTGRKYCNNTPYYYWDSEPSEECYAENQDAAKNELRYLLNLLPSEELPVITKDGIGLHII